MERIYYNINEEIDNYTMRKSKVLYCVLIDKNFLFLDKLEIIKNNEEDPQINFIFNNETIIKEDFKKTESKLKTFIKKYLNKATNLVIRITNYSEFVKDNNNIDLNCLEAFKEYEIKIENGVSYEF